MVRHRTLVSRGPLEYSFAAFDVLKALAILIASCFFLSRAESDILVADILFTVFSLLSFVANIIDLCTTSNLKKEFSDQVLSIGVTESLLYAVSGLLFFMGCFFYWPAVDQGVLGAWFFILGSLGYLIASAYNGFGLGVYAMKLTVARSDFGALFTLQQFGIVALVSGATFFVCGSMFYRPAFNGCFRDSSDELCLSTTYFGTVLYIIGAALLLMEALINIVVAPYKFSSESLVAMMDQP
mmetsp:Transcript_2368/g.6839  ORF Transcript_2368/g.6839 Transcript_2368/m.6839 type:complete len:240 (-) Transcript_2368:108-827(-)|eukprot:CAMPEP_0194482694 /NCGR_PEP_ID=MMETSP0253-20130528/4524_1 /TAXON_ID=2966 /ORGANISM="Noctiluca scintillans" /LENGTH=239 /DNA_ID=CAMNT_0039322247 /DNA_START=56 /DNA_END=775 /DNA_ORIENTATION=+